MQKIILSYIILMIISFIGCKTTVETGKNNKINKLDPPKKIEVNDPLPIDKEGWLNPSTFQVIESVYQSANDAILHEAARRRSAHLIAMSRYKLYKDEFYYIDRLADFPPFKQVVIGKIVHSSMAPENGKKRFVYRISSPALKRKIKRIVNGFEEMNPALRKKIREGDYTY